MLKGRVRVSLRDGAFGEDGDRAGPTRRFIAHRAARGVPGRRTGRGGGAEP